MSDATELLQQGVKLLRTVYGSKAAFAYEAKQWVVAVEDYLAQPTESDDE